MKGSTLESLPEQSILFREMEWWLCRYTSRYSRELEGIGHTCNYMRAIAKQPVGASALRRIDGTGNRSEDSAQQKRLLRGKKSAAFRGRLDYDRDAGSGCNDSVTLWKCAGIRGRAGRVLRNQKAPLSNYPVKLTMTRRIRNIDARSEDRDRST